VRHSIRARLLISMLVLLLPVSAGAGWLLIQVFGNRLLHDLDITLEEEAETVAELLITAARPEAITELLEHIANDSEHGMHKSIVVTRAGQVIAEVPRGAQAVMHSGDPQLRIGHYDSPDRSIAVSIAVSAAAAVHAKQRLTSLLVIGIPLVLALCGLGLAVVTGRALRPLEDASRQLDAIAADNLAIRVPVENPDDEVGRMVTVLNRMLERLQSAVAALRRFTGDAAHELRTPLTVLRTGLDVAQSRDRPAAEYRAALAEALATTDRMSRLADDLLTLARLEAAGAPRATTAVDLGEILHELADAWRADAAQDIRGHGEVAVHVVIGPDVRVHGNAGDLYRLFNNLIENALRHGTGGGAARATVVLSTRRIADRIETNVADSGPGIAPDDLHRVFDRFYRGNGARATQPGTGLGLSIAQEIARAHGGHIAAANRESGGCVFTVTLPGSTPSQA
jgi:two-component system, OmpR family, sensor kinase